MTRNGIYKNRIPIRAWLLQDNTQFPTTQKDYVSRCAMGDAKDPSLDHSEVVISAGTRMKLVSFDTDASHFQLLSGTDKGKEVIIGQELFSTFEESDEMERSNETAWKDVLSEFGILSETVTEDDLANLKKFPEELKGHAGVLKKIAEEFYNYRKDSSIDDAIAELHSLLEKFEDYQALWLELRNKVQ